VSASANGIYNIDIAEPPKGTWLEIIISQLLGLAALVLIVYSVLNHDYRALKYVILLIPAILFVLKPNLIPYLFILNFFVPITVFSKGMISAMVIDAVFLLLILAFISNKRNCLKAALETQRPLLAILCLFMLWAVIGFIYNYYGHALSANVTSAFYIFNVAQLIAAVIIFSHPDWKERRDKIIIFYIICSFFEIVAALGIEIMSGARTVDDFHKLTGTLGDHHGMLANILILGAGVASCGFFRLRDKSKRYFSIGVCLMCIALLFVSGSRSGLMGVFLSLPAIVFLNYSHKQNAWLMLFLLIPVALIALRVLPLGEMLANMLDFQNTGNPDMSTYGRLLIWERVYEHAIYGPWIQKIIGIGIGTFYTLPFGYFLMGSTSAVGAHNNYFHAFVEVGIVGLVIFLAFFIQIIRKLVTVSLCKDNAAKCYLMCTLAFLFSGLTQETFWFNPAYGRIWLQYLFCYLILFNFNDKYPKNTKVEGRIGSHTVEQASCPQ
jgi:O-antigen ligase